MAVSSQSSGARRSSGGWAARNASSESLDGFAASGYGAAPAERERPPRPLPTGTSPASAGAAQEPLLDHPRYRKLRSLNNGAHGFVQLALDTQTMQRVAIKFLRRDTFSNGSALERECACCTLPTAH